MKDWDGSVRAEVEDAAAEVDANNMLSLGKGGEVRVNDDNALEIDWGRP